MENTRLIALDPGVTTGFATATDLKIRTRGEVQGLKPLRELLEPFETDYDAIICESFELRHMGAELSPVEAIGVVKCTAAYADVPLYFQAPSQAKKFFTDDKLKALDLYVPGMRHAMDATRHLLWHISFTLRDERYLHALVASHSA